MRTAKCHNAGRYAVGVQMPQQWHGLFSAVETPETSHFRNAGDELVFRLFSRPLSQCQDHIISVATISFVYIFVQNFMLRNQLDAGPSRSHKTQCSVFNAC